MGCIRIDAYLIVLSWEFGSAVCWFSVLRTVFCLGCCFDFLSFIDMVMILFVLLFDSIVYSFAFGLKCY